MKMKIVFALLLLCAVGVDAERPGYVSVLLYHRFGEDKYPTTNISLDKFRQQLEYLRDENYRVLSMQEFRAMMDKKEPFPRKAVLITIDDAYRSIYEHAFPLLVEFEYPFTLFANVSPLYSDLPGFMNWEMLEEMRAAGVTIANHSYFHPRLGRPQQGQTRAQYAAWVRRDLEKAQLALSDHDMASDLLAYPYGEYNETVLQVARELGFALMFAQDEGGVDERTDPQRIPRVAIVGADLDMERFAFKLNLAPLHIADLAPAEVDLQHNTPASFSLRLLEKQRYRPGIINMFLSEWGRVEAQYDAETGVLSYDNADTLTRPMNRLIVTAREKEGGHFSMFSRLYFRPFVELGGSEEEGEGEGESK